MNAFRRATRAVNASSFATLARVLALALFTACCTDLPPGNTRWTQFHADGPSAGFVDVNTTDPVQLKWLADVGDVGHATPVIAPDGSIVVGNLSGTVLARREYGLEKWSRYLSIDEGPCFIASSAAVDEGGRIYVLATKAAVLDDEKPQRKGTTLYCLAPRTGATIWKYDIDAAGLTTASPKLWGRDASLVVFVYFRGDDFQRRLYVIDRDGKELAQATLGCAYPNNIRSGAFDEPWEHALLYGLLVPFGFGGAAGFLGDDPETVEEKQLDWPDPTPAVYLPSPRVIAGDIPWVVVADSRCSISAFTWDPLARALNLRWSIDDPADARYSSPTISPEGWVAVGTSTGHVNCYWLHSGALAWSYNTGEAMIGTPVFSRGHSYNYCYAGSDKHLYELGGNGTLSRKIDLHGSTLSTPAQSRDRLYATSRAGLFSFPYVAGLPGGGGSTMSGLSYRFQTEASGKGSPAIGPDGVVYNLTRDGFLRAYEIFVPPE